MNCPECGSDDLIPDEDGYFCLNCGEFLVFEQLEEKSKGFWPD